MRFQPGSQIRREADVSPVRVRDAAKHINVVHALAVDLRSNRLRREGAPLRSQKFARLQSAEMSIQFVTGPPAPCRASEDSLRCFALSKVSVA